ncbi:MAG TPA: peptidogalycan biosysnthesis protein, partial [Pseudolabrys sp.]|nr:peptidogalycan biosysnthesis protein [Pseudolabrys sp.]
MTNRMLQVRIVQSLAEVPAEAWNACAGQMLSAPDAVRSEVKLTSEDKSFAQLSTRRQPPNPFVTHEFLSSLEQSGSVGGRTGWQPRHLLAEEVGGVLVGAAPCYLKSHSRGEYVFDHGWAEAFERAGGNYYPKLLVAVPFTPVTGPRLLVRSGLQADAVRGELADALVEITGANELSSAHVTFLTEPEWHALAKRGFLRRNDRQFHWQNAGYHNFDDFLGCLASRKRKTIRRERKDALSAGIDVCWLTGSDLTESVWDAFFAFYMET